MLVVTAVCSALAEAAFLAILAQAAASLVEGSSEISISLGPWNTTFQLGFLLTLGVGIAAVRLVLQIIVSFLPARIAAGIQSELRNDLYVAFTHSSWGVQSQDLEGHFQELATNQIAQASQGILQAVVFLIAASTFVILVSSALVLNVFAATLVLVIAIALLAILRPASNLGRHQAQKLSGAYIDYASGVNETVRLAEESRVFGVGESLRERMSGVIYGVGDAFFRTQLMVRLISNGYQSVLYLLIAVALTVLYLVDAGQIAALGAIVLLLIRAGNYGQQIQNAYQVVRQSLPYIERVQAGTRRYEEASIGTGTRPLRSVESVSFDHVSFSYLDDRPALTDVSFKVDAGELIGIVGPSGAGKSTLVQILLGIREPDGGHFLINGEEAAEIRRSDWHRLVSYVPQRPQLLQASVADNISFFRSVSEEDIHRAAVQAGIHDDILSWPDGYDTMVGPRANAISGGEQQRICLARALVANPEVLILDEPTSALDPHSELLIQRSLDELKHQLTLFVVAHRLSTLASCERIMVIVDGKLDKFDRASELRLSSDYFRTATDIVTSATIDQA